MKNIIKVKSIGRRRKEEDDDYYCCKSRDPFWVDENWKIALSKAYRRLEGKTQVFYLPESPYTRTRMTHTTEVRAISSFIARSLGLDCYLTQAIALGHDIGHVPFGHLGERFLSEKVKGKFRHNSFAVIVAEFIERNGEGLNLCYETLEGIYRHSGDIRSFDYDYPQEYFAVRLADKIAYIFSDYNDAKRLGYLKSTDKPNPIEDLGEDQRDRVKNVLTALLSESKAKGKLEFKDSFLAKRFLMAYNWMFENIYSRADDRIDMEVLENGFNFIQEKLIFDGCNPILVFGLLTEKEIRKFANLNISKKEEIDLLERTGIRKVLSSVRGIEFEDFESFPLTKEDFKT